MRTVLGGLVLLSAVRGSSGSWSRCTARTPPDYSATPDDHAHPEVSVSTGEQAIPFSLRRASDTSEVSLSGLLQTKPVFLQFGAYT